VLAVLAFTPIGLASLFGFVVWSLVVGILIHLRNGSPSEAAPAAVQPAVSQ
jgi:hypothetical protein